MDVEFSRLSLEETKKRLQNLPKLFDKIEGLLENNTITNTKRAHVLIEYIQLLLKMQTDAKTDLERVKDGSGIEMESSLNDDDIEVISYDDV